MQPNSIKPSHPQSQTPTKQKSRGSFLKIASMSCRSCLFFSVVILFFVFITTTTRAPKSSQSPTTFLSLKYSNACESGRIYVYDLPSKFNKQLLTKCDYKEQWQCDMSINNGFSRRADKLASIMPDTLSPAWYRTDQFSLEVIYHNRMLNYKCRTKEAELATAFYIPFYAGLALAKYLFNNHTKEERDFLGEKLLTWLQAQPYWNRSKGSDHFMAIGRISCDFRRLTDPDKTWGSNFLNLPLMQTTTRLIIERNPKDHYDIAVPYPSGFHPHSDSQLSQWQEFVRTRNRTRLVSFVGGTRPRVKNDFRAFLLNQCRSESELCTLVDCSVSHCVDNSETVDAFIHTDFCLQPRGDSPTRRSVFDCMISGSIPVFFWNATFDYEWFFPEQTSYSVFIDYGKVMNGTSIWRVLTGYSRERVEMMRERVIELIPNIVYAMPSGGLMTTRDAFDIAVDGVLRRFKENVV